MLIDRYQHTQRMVRALEAIHQARDLLEEHLTRPEDWHGVIRRQVMAAVVHYSTAIEGNQLSRDQVESIIAGEALEVPEKDRVEALNYYRAMRWAQTRAQDPGWRLSHETILTLHFMVGTELGGDYEPLGQYRHAQNTVQDRRSGESIYWPPRVHDVQALMSAFIEDVRRRSDGPTDPYLVNALAHLNFVAIHPFSDGNGRVGRLLCSLLMMRQGFKAQAFWSLEQFLGEHALDYGTVLARTLGPRWSPDHVDATGWIEWYLEAVATQVGRAERHLARAMAEFSAVLGAVAATLDLGGSTRPPSRTVIPLWLAMTGGTVTRRQLLRYVDAAEVSLTRDLRRLCEQQLLELRGAGRAAHYVPGPRVRPWGDFDELVELALAGGAPAVERVVRGRSHDELGLFDV